ncbi:hypothetical protein [Nesterenkonia sp.]|uniref:hypothetical protein n=1 Tax=Nesterenkonia sp. TaxID=704201 RepID=UPI0026191AED|nr:hypothetical protein [Nesterenkonia sp.]
MSDYDATTEKVRRAWQYAQGPCACCLGGYCMENGIEFDKWLQQVRTEATDEMRVSKPAEQPVHTTVGMLHIGLKWLTETKLEDDTG